MSDYDLMEAGCEGCVRLLAKINELKTDLDSQGLKDQNVRDAREGAFHDALSFAGLDPIEGYTEEEALERFGGLRTQHESALRDRDEFDRKYQRALMLQKGAEKQCARVMKTREHFKYFIEEVVRCGTVRTSGLSGVAQRVLEEHDHLEPKEKAKADRDKKLIMMATITSCILTICSYCKASHAIGKTTEHTCIAKPLWKLWDEKASEISDE